MGVPKEKSKLEKNDPVSEGPWYPNNIIVTLRKTCGRITTLTATHKPLSQTHITAMATLSFNPARIKTPTFKPSKLTSPSKPITIPCTTLHFKSHPKLVHFRTHSVSESTQKEAPQATLQEEDDPTAELRYLDPETDPATITDWELDFCSRPILDARGKKIWELVVCDKTLSLQYTKYFPNNVINSVTLKDGIVAISDELGVPLPRNIRFFR